MLCVALGNLDGLKMNAVDSLVPDAPHKPIVPFVLQLPEVPPKLSATTFPWPDAFCNDLLVFLKNLGLA